MPTQIADVVIIKNNLALLVQERKQSAYAQWNFPGGRLEEGETIESAAHREIQEELGVELTDAKFIKAYTIPTPTAELKVNILLGKII